MSYAWEKQDIGWYTCDLGGVAQEADGMWYFYPIGSDPRKGPYESAKSAKEAARRKEKA
jgi:hypothetical protein